jgi:hypothetical protein
MAINREQQAANNRQTLMRFETMERTDKKDQEMLTGGGRKMIILLFLLSIGLSLLFWFQGQFAEWLRSFFGPSTWTITR